MANWGNLTSRGQVEDRRSAAPVAVGGLSLTGLALYFLVTYLTGGNLGDVLSQLPNVAVQQNGSQAQTDTSQFQGKDRYEVFASTILGSTNDMWSAVFQGMGKTYVAPKLVLFRSSTSSGCGGATSAEGPHYCPLDNTIYLDETFFDELKNRFGGSNGDVAQGYVIAHEAGHHTQALLGTMSTVNRAVERDPSLQNAESVKLELQADCFAGMWAHSIKEKQVLGPGEINEALSAASAVGDDRIQGKVTGRITPETWTHGSSSQRVSWFTKGYDTGNLADCNTFQ
jgi:predicted metalloprotease